MTRPTVAQLADIFCPIDDVSQVDRTDARFAIPKLKADHPGVLENRLHEHHRAVKQRHDDLWVLAEGTDPQPSGLAKLLAGDDRW